MAHSLSCPHTPAGLGMLPLLTHTPSGGSSCRGSVYPPHPAEVGLQDWHHLGMAPRVGNPFSHSPSLSGSATSAPIPLMQHQSHAVTPLDAQDSCGINPVGIWLPGQHVLGTGTSRAGVCGCCSGQKSSCVYFPSAAGNNRGKFFFFFFVIHFIFSRLCVFFTSQNPSCKHPAVSLGGGRCPASHSAASCPPPTHHRGHRRVPKSLQLSVVPVT